MALEWALIFQGVSAAAAIVEAVKAALEARKLTREEIHGIAAEAEAQARSNDERAFRATREVAPALDKDIEEVFRGKIEKAKKKWKEAIDNSDDQADWARATDVLRSDTCAILRMVRELNGGTLPGDWYQIWVANQCR